MTFGQPGLSPEEMPRQGAEGAESDLDRAGNEYWALLEEIDRLKELFDKHQREFVQETLKVSAMSEQEKSLGANWAAAEEAKKLMEETGAELKRAKAKLNDLHRSPGESEGSAES